MHWQIWEIQDISMNIFDGYPTALGVYPPSSNTSRLVNVSLVDKNTQHHSGTSGKP